MQKRFGSYFFLIYLCIEQLKINDMTKSRIYISADKTKAVLVMVFSSAGSFNKKEITYTIKGQRWVTPLEEIIKNNPDAKVLQEN